MKKIISTLAATMMAATSFSAFSAFASEENVISLSSASLNSAITTDDGTVIPVGATAITVTISNNTGFYNKSVKFDAGSADIIVDEAGVPVVDCGSVLKESVIGASENNGVMMIATASAEISSGDGDIFTFYVNSNSDDVSVTDVDSVCPAKNATYAVAGRPYYIIGDIDNDGYINSSDASFILSAVSRYKEKYHDDVLPVPLANSDLTYYFPSHTPAKAEVADCNENGYITRYDAECAMNYYSAMATGKDADTDTMGYCGEIRYYDPIKQ
ncbi:MAG: hypothetical protein K2J26_01265 [Ruminococcus sp.]|nr:hypothetical protein [Ruminococcus sp.]